MFQSIALTPAAPENGNGIFAIHQLFPRVTDTAANRFLSSRGGHKQHVVFMRKSFGSDKVQGL